MSSLELYAALGAILFAVYLAFGKGLFSRRLPYPPGPRGYPFIGNALSIPLKDPWLYYTEIADEYGGYPPRSPHSKDPSLMSTSK